MGFLGSNVVFESLDINYEVEKDAIELEHLNIQVFDKNSAYSDKLIGITSTSVRFLLDHKV